MWDRQLTQTEADEHLANLKEPQSEQVHQSEVGRHGQNEGVYV